MSTRYTSCFSVNGYFAFAPVPSPPPYIPEDPKSLSSAAVGEIVPSFYIVSTRDDDQGRLSGVCLRVHNLSGDRALKLAEAFEAAAKQLRDPRNHDRVFDRKDPGVDIDLSAALVR
jgi:hypothetical protein